MRKFTFLLLILSAFATSSLLAQEPTAAQCQNFHTGTFYVKEMPNVIITRDDKYQIETDPATGTYVKMSITWISDCTYQLRLVKTTVKKDKKLWKKMKVLTVTITSTEESSYTFSATSPIFTEPVTGIIIKK
ncbi:MAG: hypothetical protein ABIQ40_16315 [Bacteroidia bacterium]